MANMRSPSRILMFILPASFALITGCNKVDFEDRSKITISGNTLENTDLNKTWEVNGGEYEGFYGTGCEAVIYKTEIQLTLESGAILNISLMQQSYDEKLPEGTYSVVDTECETGIMANFTYSEPKKALYTLEISAGTMKVKDDEGTFDINFDFTISPASGGGKLTGNFTGTMVHTDFR